MRTNDLTRGASAPSRRRIAVVLAGLSLIVSGWLGGRAILREMHRRDRASQVHAEAVEYAQEVHVSMEVATAICELCGDPGAIARMSPTELRRLATRYADFEGPDRARVARYCNGLFHPASIRELSDEQLEIARNATRDIIGEFWNEPKILGQAYLVAAGLGLRDDPYIKEMANQTLQEPGLDPTLADTVIVAILRPQK